MMSRITGINLQSEIDHIRQSIQDILTTPIGTRIMRREYASLLPQLIDSPFNEITLLQLYAATATALLQWEDRITLNSVSINQVGRGSFELEIDCNVVDNNQQQSLSIPLNFGSTL